ncbi:MAG: hypothetical protein R3D59_00060 [Paracoccaceae bacterium]
MTAAPLSLVPVFLALALHISGCAAPLTPEAQCFAEATVDYRAAWREAEAIRADLDRGHALERLDSRQAEALPCRADDGARAYCLYETHSTLLLSVPIDRAALTRRLAALEEKMDRLRPPAMARAAPCGFAAQLAETGSPRVLP